MCGFQASPPGAAPYITAGPDGTGDVSHSSGSAWSRVDRSGLFLPSHLSTRAHPLTLVLLWLRSDPAVSNRTHSTLRGDVTIASPTPLIVLAVLIAGDLLFVGLHLLHLQTSLLPSNRWSIGQDHGVGEMFQYMKFVFICLVLGRLFVRTHWRALLGWIAVFAFLLIDDAGRIHERFGLALAGWAHLPDLGPVRASDIGELVYALLVGLLALPIVAIGWLRSVPPARAISADLTVFLLGLAGCGVGADLLHRILSATVVDWLVGLLEDGGEMLVLSATCAYVIQWATATDVRHESQIRYRIARLFGF
jgi:hypothetical protein